MLNYRRLTVESVTRRPNSLEVNFKDSRISLEFNFEILREKGIRNISPGDHLFVSGKSGNNDASLWGFDPLVDFRKESKE